MRLDQRPILCAAFLTLGFSLIPIAAAAQVRARERARRLDVDDDVAGADVAADGDGLLELGTLRGSTLTELETTQARACADDVMIAT